MHIEFRWHLSLQLVEKLDKLFAPMTRYTLTDDLAAENIKGRKERGGAMALVIVRPSFRQTWAQRQQRRSAIQGLNLAFFINAQHQGAVWGIKIQPDHIAHLLCEVWIVRKFEVFDAMRLQFAALPS